MLTQEMCREGETGGDGCHASTGWILLTRRRGGLHPRFSTVRRLPSHAVALTLHVGLVRFVGSFRPSAVQRRRQELFGVPCRGVTTDTDFLCSDERLTAKA